MIRLVITVPLDAPKQIALERAAHTALAADMTRDWSVSIAPFITMSGGLLEVESDGRVERRLLDALTSSELERALRQIVSHPRAPAEEGADRAL